jgi:hypothetical protein
VTRWGFRENRPLAVDLVSARISIRTAWDVSRPQREQVSVLSVSGAI